MRCTSFFPPSRAASAWARSPHAGGNSVIGAEQQVQYLAPLQIGAVRRSQIRIQPLIGPENVVPQHSVESNRGAQRLGQPAGGPAVECQFVAEAVSVAVDPEPY